MARLSPIPPDQMSAEQRRVHDRIAAGPRGRVTGPFTLLLRSPEVAERVQNLGEFLRFDISLAPHLKELAILMVARLWTCQYEWYAHEPFARESNLDSALIEAIRLGRRPQFNDGEEEAVHDLTRGLVTNHVIDDAVYERCMAFFGEATVVELVNLIAYYALIAHNLNAFEVDLPDGAEPPLPPLPA
ncbi:MAG: carboxymuconolactone decarboxylase family protein [Rhodospirillales bacterium]|jgi:4-carboxymuconolactone decarboxylase|nr:carboxymuconolactone decarboxylase family protein [Rhodospirillales bacterium]